MNSETIAIIVEGDSREMHVMKSMKSVFFRNDQVKLISFPAGQNIYMLWKRMEDDNYDTDIIEVIREYDKKAKDILEGYTREDFSEVYLFFDYDGHQDNLSDSINGNEVLEKMLNTFDNETENGKLYISYPMVEAIRDYIPHDCKTPTGCTLKLYDMDTYKRTSAQNVMANNISRYQIEEWKDVFNIFVMRMSCLYEYGHIMSFDEYRKEVYPGAVFEKEKKYMADNSIFIISAFPEFLLDYHKKSFWMSLVKRQWKHC